jgi:mono/diheme cytochrome c family protein
MSSRLQMAILKISICAATIAVALASSAFAQSDEVASGRRLAESWCSSCHQIGPEASTGPAPSFPQLARLPSTTELSIKVFLQSNHENMPNLMLTRAQMDDLAAYILSLKLTK